MHTDPRLVLLYICNVGKPRYLSNSQNYRYKISGKQHEKGRGCETDSEIIFFKHSADLTCKYLMCNLFTPKII